MAIATDQQVQSWSDQRARVRAEQIRALYNAIADDIGGFDSAFAALTQPNPTWTDARTDGPPNLLGPSDLLAMNAVIHAVKDALDANSNMVPVLKACVRPVGQ